MRRKVSTIWTEAGLLKLAPLLSDKQVARIYRAGGSPDPDYRDVWRVLTPGERAYLLVFWSATKFRFTDKLVALCGGDRALALKIRSELKKDNDATERGILTVTPQRIESDNAKRDDKRKKRDTPEDTPYRHHGWTRDDVASEAMNRDLEPLLGPPKFDPIWIPERDIPPSPVRQVSIEEYEATKQRPKKGDRNLSFLPKGNHNPSDNVYEGDDLWYEADPRQNMAGYDDPRQEDGPHNPRYSPE